MPRAKKPAFRAHDVRPYGGRSPSLPRKCPTPREWERLPIIISHAAPERSDSARTGAQRFTICTGTTRKGKTTAEPAGCFQRGCIALFGALFFSPLLFVRPKRSGAPGGRFRAHGVRPYGGFRSGRGQFCMQKTEACFNASVFVFPSQCDPVTLQPSLPLRLPAVIFHCRLDQKHARLTPPACAPAPAGRRRRCVPDPRRRRTRRFRRGSFRPPS